MDNKMTQWLGRQIAGLAGPYLKQQPRSGDAATSFFSGETPLLSSLGGLSRSSEDWERLAATSEWVLSDIRTIANICAHGQPERLREAG